MTSRINSNHNRQDRQSAFITAAKGVHGDRYDYSDVEYTTAKTKVIIHCSEHGSFEQAPVIHLRGSGCKECAKGKMSRAISPEIAKANLKKIHPDLDYSKFVYTRRSAKITMICPRHGEFVKTYASMAQGQGCPTCGRLRSTDSRRADPEATIEKLTEMHPTLDFSEAKYLDSRVRLTVSCPEHGPFQALYNNLMLGGGCPECSGWGPSKDETTILDMIESWGVKVIRNDRGLISPKEIDGYLPDHSLAIEYCGLYWHSEMKGRGRTYHRDKLRACEAKGVRLITIFEDEWNDRPDIVLRRLRHAIGINTTKLAARKCQVREIPLSEARDFLNEHHLQGYTGCRVRYGIFHDEVLEGVMTFALPSRAKGAKDRMGDHYEVSRFATKSHIMGAGSKILAAFKRDYDPSAIYTFADLRWGTGASYLNMGFTLSHDTDPNYWYIKGMARIHRFALRKNSDDDQALTEWENRQLQGYDRIWDCGHRKFTMELKA